MIESLGHGRQNVTTSRSTAEWVSASDLGGEGLPESQKHCLGFFKALVDSGAPSTRWVSNVQTRVKMLRLGDSLLPVTVNEEELENAWVCSPYNAVITYAGDEVRHLPSAGLRVGIRMLLAAVAPVLRAARINRVVAVNNALLSTNLYPELRPDQVDYAVRVLRETFPTHAILWRSLNEIDNAGLMQRLASSGYLLAPIRQVWCFDGGIKDLMRRQNNRHDWRLFRSQPMRVLTHHMIDSGRINAMRRRYDQLYLDKYSRHNPQYTNEVFSLWHQSGMLRFTALADRRDHVVATVGTYQLGRTITAPIVGYDTSLSPSLGLYRRLMSIVLRDAAENGLFVNLSSGAASFKRLRGGQPTLEYIAVDVSHLSFARRNAWASLAGLMSRIGGPLLDRFQL